MKLQMKLQWKSFIIAIAIPLAAGGLSALLTQGNRDLFQLVNKPPLTPPGWVFPIVWTVLYILMGIASYLIYIKKPISNRPCIFYFTQLCFNFLWSFFFFNQQWYLFSFLWLAALWILILFTFAEFYCISKVSGYLLIPYLVWVILAGYLNLGICLLN